MELIGYVVMIKRFNDKTFLLHAPIGSKWEECKEVCRQMIIDIEDHEQKAIAQAAELEQSKQESHSQESHGN